MSDYPMLISNKLHSFRNFTVPLNHFSKDRICYGNKAALDRYKLFLNIYEVCFSIFIINSIFSCRV